MRAVSGSTGPTDNRMARPSRNQRSADSFVRAFLPPYRRLADKAVRAPGKFSQNATMSGDSIAKRLNSLQPATALSTFGSIFTVDIIGPA